MINLSRLSSNLWVYLLNFKDFGHGTYIGYPAPLAFIIGLICLAIACSLLSSITNYSNHLSTENHVGFALLEFTFLYYALTLVHCIAYRICSNVIQATDLRFKISDDNSLLPMYLLLLVIFAAGISVVLLHFKLANDNNTFFYVYILISVWVFMMPIIRVAGWIMETCGFTKEKFIRNYLIFILLILSLPLGFTMLAFCNMTFLVLFRVYWLRWFLFIPGK